MAAEESRHSDLCPSLQLHVGPRTLRVSETNTHAWRKEETFPDRYQHTRMRVAQKAARFQHKPSRSRAMMNEFLVARGTVGGDVDGASYGRECVQETAVRAVRMPATVLPK